MLLSFRDFERSNGANPFPCHSRAVRRLAFTGGSGACIASDWNRVGRQVRLDRRPRNAHLFVVRHSEKVGAFS
jgi:hypothetical protein